MPQRVLELALRVLATAGGRDLALGEREEGVPEQVVDELLRRRILLDLLDHLERLVDLPLAIQPRATRTRARTGLGDCGRVEGRLRLGELALDEQRTATLEQRLDRFLRGEMDGRGSDEQGGEDGVHGGSVTDAGAGPSGSAGCRARRPTAAARGRCRGSAGSIRERGAGHHRARGRAGHVLVGVARPRAGARARAR